MLSHKWWDLGAVPFQARSLTSMILVGLFHAGYSMTFNFVYRTHWQMTFIHAQNLAIKTSVQVRNFNTGLW